ncbi:vacuolar protein-sorting-associated protein 25 [[Candida] anglica]|uniref:Vacuolar protein-sorting-associated protein 25 n=1 Tax=[Candida] anglica TaxID=148631 RepID=A0ABP0E9Z0_9ASCO
MSVEFVFPKIHSFPPLYTKQPNATVLNNQLDTWCEILLDYCEHYKISSISNSGKILYSQYDSIENIPPIFDNKDINRVVNDEFKSTIFRHLIQKLKRAEYKNPKSPDSGIILYWKSISEWCSVLYGYVERSGQLGSILTVYELTQSSDSGLPDELKNIEYDLLVRVLKYLVKQGKAQILMADDGTDQIGGVKIV